MINKFSPPWQNAEWRAEAEAWIIDRLAERGLRATAPIEQIHAQPWSTVLRVPTTEGDLFFKAGGPTQRFEPGLLKLLKERRPADVLPLLAADVERGWSLLPDGGITLRTKSDGNPNLEAWSEILPSFAALQIASSGWQPEMLATGIPDRRLAQLPQIYVDILNDREVPLISDDEDGLSAEQHARLLALAPTVKEMFAELEALGVPPTLEHGDLHDANIFAQESGYRIFDWGDAALTHPFFSFLLPLRFASHKLGIREHDAHPKLIELRDLYLRPWTDFAPLAKLRQAWQLAHHLSKFVRTINWYQVVKTTESDKVPEYRLSVSGWFLEFLSHPTNRFS